MYLVIRIRGTTGVLSGIASTLEMLRLNRISHAVLVEENPSYEGMRTTSLGVKSMSKLLLNCLKREAD